MPYNMSVSLHFSLLPDQLEVEVVCLVGIARAKWLSSIEIENEEDLFPIQQVRLFPNKKMDTLLAYMIGYPFTINFIDN